MCLCIGLMAEPVQAYPRVPQGGVVYLNETYDISGVAAGYNNLVYINQYSTDLSAANWTITTMIDTPATKEEYYNYTFNPDFFGDKLGYWYRYNGVYESNANNRAFRVVQFRPAENYTYNKTELLENFFPPAPPVIPEHHVADYLLARGDPFNVTYNFSKASVWIFGRVNGIYDRKVINGTAKFNHSETASLESGSYSLLYYSPGEDKQFDIRLDGDTLEYFDSQAFKVRTVDLKPLSPMVVLDRLRWVATQNDDNFTVYKLEVQEPKIDVVSVDTIVMNETTQSAVLQVRGYTNLANNTLISFVLDEDKTPEKIGQSTRAQNRWNSTVLAVENPGSMRYFDYSIPVWMGAIPSGKHEITVYGELNAKMIIPFWVYDLPEGSRMRNSTIKYVGGYEFVPTPTPEIIVQEKIVQAAPIVQQVTVEVPPSDEQVRAQQAEVVKGYAILALAGGVLLLAVLFGVKYLYGAWKRSRLE
jgi:hypothetical protein